MVPICGKTIKNTDIIDYQDTLEKSLDDLSDHLESYVNWKTILELSKKNINDSNQYE